MLITGNQKIVGTASGIDINKWTNEAGLNIPAADPTAWQMVKPPEMPQYILQRRDTAFNNERPIVTRFSDQLSGIRQRGVDTATEALALQQSGLANVDADKAKVQLMLEDALVYALELAKENWTEEQAFKITNKRNEFLWYNPSKLKKIPRLIPSSIEYKQKWSANNPDMEPPEYMQATDLNDSGEEEAATKNAMFDLKVSIGAGIPNNKAFRYNATKEAMQNGAMDIQEYRQRLRDLGILPENEYEQELAKIQKLEALQQQRATRGKDAGGEGLDPNVEGLNSQNAPQGMREMRRDITRGNFGQQQ